MEVTFTKVDGKRYAVAIDREHGPALVPRFAPGYDDLMPHDLAQFLVEEQFRIELGVFGQLAAGGGGIFAPAPADNNSRFQRSARRLATIGRDDMARSERLVVVAVAEWERGIGRRKHQPHVPIDDVLDDLEPAQLRACIARLDHVSGQWKALQFGGSLTFEWPRQLTFDAAGSQRGRRRSRQRASGRQSP